MFFSSCTSTTLRDVYKSNSILIRCDQARGGQARILYDDLQTIKSYINPYHGACDPFGIISNPSFSESRRVDLEPCLAHSRIPNVHQTNARVRKCTCERKGSKRGLSSKLAPISPFVNIWNVAKGYVFMYFNVLLGFYRAKRNFRLLNKIHDLYIFRFRSTYVE